MTRLTSPHAARLAALRTVLDASGHDGFLVPMADAYQSEYVPASDQRIGFLSGFTGSAGFIIVLRDRAVFFTDGRYTLQARHQMDATLFDVQDSTKIPPTEWLAAHLPCGAKIAYDPWLHTDAGVARLKKAVEKAGGFLAPVARNPVDAIWADRPAAPTAPIHPYDLAYSGQSSADKRTMIAAELKKAGCAAAVITDPASIAWVLNVRGGDVPNTPLPLSFAILHDSGAVTWFVDPRKVTEGLDAHLGPDVTRAHPDHFAMALDALGSANKPIRIDPSESASWIIERLRAAKITLDGGDDPCVLPKACKNAVELDGMHAAHRRDGVALVSFLAWLDQTVASGQTVTELMAEDKLASFRAAHNLYRGPSFDTIAGSGPHGAIVHYRATSETNRALGAGELFLLDSGGQYLDGTTDVTRTVAIGQPTAEMRDRFTRVLRGHIALASVQFPSGTTGADLDVLARQYLWAVGLDYNHGTGHGVGSYLGVHEGPQAISRRNHVALKPGMVVSNEPGFYQADAYGIRIENLQAVVARESGMLGFEPLTLAPIDVRLIDETLLSAEDKGWLNAYHARVRETLTPMLDLATASWLATATRDIQDRKALMR